MGQLRRRQDKRTLKATGVEGSWVFERVND